MANGLFAKVAEIDIGAFHKALLQAVATHTDTGINLMPVAREESQHAVSILPVMWFAKHSVTMNNYSIGSNQQLTISQRLIIPFCFQFGQKKGNVGRSCAIGNHLFNINIDIAYREP